MGIKLYTSDHDKYWLAFDCPGCGYLHAISYEPGRWTWNGSMERPTFTPSLLSHSGEPEHICHAYVTDGRIQFLTDSKHALAGQTVDIPDISHNY